MREIKFRAWDKDDKVMFIPSAISMTSCGIWYSRQFKDGINIKHYSEGTSLREVFLMQYTGLKDRNDKEIYEGDIVIYKWDGDNEILMQTIFKDGEFRLSPLRDDYIFKVWDIRVCNENHKIEVTGNIYQNPELL